MQQCGGNFLHDVPYSPHGDTDYSILAPALDQSEPYVVSQVHSVAVESINEYLYELWENAVRLVQSDDPLSICLAEIKSTSVTGYTAESHFFARFDAPEIKALCPQEVVLFFHLKDIVWFKSGAPDR